MTVKCPKCHSDNPDTQKFCDECAAPLTASEDIQPSLTKTLLTPVEDLPQGTLFANRYEIIEELGKGGMGRVYKALDKEIHEEVAIKLLKPEIAADEKIIERFRNELKIARKISHKNVCRTYHISKEEGTPYITMEYVRGEGLKSLVKNKGRLPKEEALGIAKQVCEGLVEAHKLGVVHRDLKPQNIMIDEKGNAKIMDFGIARSVEAPGVTQTGVIIGTPDYISPEQAEGEEADHRSDIYSLGVILYEMVTGSVPFKGDTALSVALKHKAQLPTDPRKWNPEISDDLARLILICMEKERGRRYQTAEALHDDLRNIEEGFPLGTKIRSRRETFVASIIRKKFFIPALIVVLAIFAVVFWQLLPREEVISPAQSDRPSVAIMYFKNNTGDPALDYLSESLTSQLTYDLMQSKYLYVLPNDRLIQIMNRLDLQGKGNYSTDELENVADWGEVEHVIQGGYFKAGDDFRISIQIQKTGSWEIIGSETLSSQIERQMAMVDELTPKIKSYFNISAQDITGDIDLDIGQITTRSPEAFTYYNEGVKHWASGRSDEAIKSFKKAIEIDPQLAMAHIFLAHRYSARLLPSQAREHIEKALSLAEHLTDRDRYFVEAEAFQYGLLKDQEGKSGGAEESYKKILELYPEDWLANYNLGEMYLLGMEEWKKARELFLENRRNKVDFVRNYQHLAATYEFEGLYDEAIETYKYYLENFSDSPRLRERLASAYLCKGQLDLALAEVDNAISLNQSPSGNWLKGAILLCMEDWPKAEEEFQILINRDIYYSRLVGIEGMGHMLRTQGKLKKSIELYEEGLREAKAMGYVDYEFIFLHQLAYADFQQGDLKEALNKSDTALKLPMGQRRQVQFQFLKGYIYLRMGSITDAQDAAEELKNLLDNEVDNKLIRYYFLLMGLIECSKNNYKDAEKYQLQALSLLPFPHYYAQRWDDHAVFYDALAMTYHKSGELDKAQMQYERIISLTEGRLNFGIIYAKSFYRLGQIFEQKGWKGKAIEQYEKFLDLWKDANPEQPEIEDVRNRLAKLIGN